MFICFSKGRSSRHTIEIPYPRKIVLSLFESSKRRELIEERSIHILLGNAVSGPLLMQTLKLDLRYSTTQSGVSPLDDSQGSEGIHRFENLIWGWIFNDITRFKGIPKCVRDSRINGLFKVLTTHQSGFQFVPIARKAISKRGSASVNQ
jgi:hypothetical protein